MGSTTVARHGGLADAPGVVQPVAELRAHPLLDPLGVRVADPTQDLLDCQLHTHRAVATEFTDRFEVDEDVAELELSLDIDTDPERFDRDHLGGELRSLVPS